MLPEKNRYNILLKDENWIVVNKPSGMLSIPDRTQSEPSLKDILQEKYGTVMPVHRLDKDTSGLIIYARNPEAHRHLSIQFEAHLVEKFYVGLVLGRPADEAGELTGPIAENPAKKGTMIVHRTGKPSHTSFRILEANHSFSLLEFQLHTGRTHQIRVHCKTMGHPIVADPIYGDGKAVFLSAFKRGFKLGKYSDDKPIIDRLALHAFRLSFKGISGEKQEFIAPIPKEFTVLMKQLKS